MSSARQRILEMVAKGEIDTHEAEQLLGALDGKTRSTWRALLDPFETLSTPTGAMIAVLAITASVGLIGLNVRFDGVLDFHVVSGPLTLMRGLADQLAAWLLPSATLWATAWFLGQRARAIDLLIAVGIARLPMFLGGLTSGILLSDAAELTKISRADQLPLSLVLALVVVLPCIALFVAWLYFGFKTASGLKGPKLVAGLIAALIVAEIASKIAISAFSL